MSFQREREGRGQTGSIILAAVGLWDDAFSLLERFFSENLFSTLLESGLQTMLAEARLASLAGWLELAHSRRVVAPIIDLAEGEIAFHQGKRAKSEALALRAAKSLGDTHPMLSRAFYLAGLSVHLDCYHDRARQYFDQALASASTVAQKRDAVWGQLLTSLDLGDPDANDLLSRLIDLDDGSALSEVRLATARYQVAIRRGRIRDCADALSSAEHVAERVTEPHTRSSFHVSQLTFLVQLGRYAEALAAVIPCERYARNSRVSFILPFTKRVRAVAELGLRHFARCSQLVEWVEAEAIRSGDVFLELEARLIRARLFIAQGLADRGVRVLEAPPKRFPWEGERGEYLATLGLALACASDTKSALECIDESSRISETVEVRALGACVTAIGAIEDRSSSKIDCALDAFRTALDVGSVDSFVIAYRGYPNLLACVVQDPTLHEPLREVIDRARDWSLGKAYHLDPGPRKPSDSSLSS